MAEENQAPGAEQQTQDTPSGAPAKKKKINKLSPEQLNKKISEMEQGSHLQCRYYKDLVLRKKEMETSAPA